MASFSPHWSWTIATARTTRTADEIDSMDSQSDHTPQLLLRTKRTTSNSGYNTLRGALHKNLSNNQFLGFMLIA